MNTDPSKSKRLWQTMRHRRKFLLAAGILVVVTGLCAHRYYTGRLSSRHSVQYTPKPPARPYFTGVTHTVSANGRKQLTLSCDEIRIRKGKLGLLRFGPFKEAVIVNARIEIYRYSSDRGKPTVEPPDNAAKNISDPKGEAPERWPPNFISPKILTAMGIDDVRGLSFKRADVKSFDDDRLSWRITAGKAVAKHQPQRIEFSDNVMLWRPTGTRQTRRLTLNLTTGAID